MTKECTIILKDEVNCKIDGVDPVTRRKLIKALSFFLQYARHTMAYKIGQWDGMKSYCDVGGRTYINLLDKLLPILMADGYDVFVDDKRSTHRFEFDLVTESEHADIKWPENHVKAGESIMLRDHQVLAINDFLSNSHGLGEISTGAGKTVITATLSKKAQKYGRTFVIVPNVDLVLQTKRDYELLGLDVGVYYGDKKEIGKTHTICTWQSLEALDKKEDTEYTLADATAGCIAVIVDECFHGDSLVKTTSGHKKIKDIQIGDHVINYSEVDGIFKEDMVVGVYKNMVISSEEKMYELEMDNGVIIKVTGNHKFLTEIRGWVRADELTQDDEIISFNER